MNKTMLHVFSYIRYNVLNYRFLGRMTYPWDFCLNTIMLHLKIKNILRKYENYSYLSISASILPLGLPYDFATVSMTRTGKQAGIAIFSRTGPISINIGEYDMFSHVKTYYDERFAYAWLGFFLLPSGEVSISALCDAFCFILHKVQELTVYPYDLTYHYNYRRDTMSVALTNIACNGYPISFVLIPETCGGEKTDDIPVNDSEKPRILVNYPYCICFTGVDAFIKLNTNNSITTFSPEHTICKSVLESRNYIMLDDSHCDNIVEKKMHYIEFVDYISNYLDHMRIENVHSITVRVNTRNYFSYQEEIMTYSFIMVGEKSMLLLFMRSIKESDMKKILDTINNNFIITKGDIPFRANMDVHIVDIPYDHVQARGFWLFMASIATILYNSIGAQIQYVVTEYSEHNNDKAACILHIINAICKESDIDQAVIEA